jgi:hypothetical protein
LEFPVAKKKTQVVVNKNGKQAGDAIELDGAAPVRVKALSGVKYVLKGEGDVGPETATLTRVGDDLCITLEGQTTPALVLEGYFSLSEPSGIYGVAEDGQLYAYGRTDGGDIFSLAIGDAETVALAGDPVPTGDDDHHYAFLPLLAGGGLAAAGIGMAFGGGGGGGNKFVLPPSEEQKRNIIDREAPDAVKDLVVTDDVGDKQADRFDRGRRRRHLERQARHRPG